MCAIEHIESQPLEPADEKIVRIVKIVLCLKIGKLVIVTKIQN